MMGKSISFRQRSRNVYWIYKCMHNLQTRQPHSTATAGFSLLEVLVAVGLLLVAVVGPMTFFARSSQSAEVANDRAIATFLAQEGAELVQKMRDDRMLEYFLVPNEDGWGEFLDDTELCRNGSPCGVSINSDAEVSVIDCPSDSVCELRYDASAGRSRFHHGSAGVDTQFIRTVELELSSDSDTADREVEIVSRVQWESTALAGSQSVEVRTAVFNIFTAAGQ